MQPGKTILIVDPGVPLESITEVVEVGPGYFSVAGKANAAVGAEGGRFETGVRNPEIILAAAAADTVELRALQLSAQQDAQKPDH